MVGRSNGLDLNIRLAFRHFTVSITWGIFGFSLLRPKVTLVDFLEILEDTRRRPNTAEDIVDNRGYAEAGEERHLVDSCCFKWYGSASCDCGYRDV